MCGLVGVAGAITKGVEDAFHTLLQLDTIRGPHSTGVLIVNKDKEASVHKALGTPWELFDSKKYYKAMNNGLNVLIGHNRFATKGAVNVKNAHPFEFENVIGCHNGTLSSQVGLDDHNDFVVDSENIYHHMNNNGVEGTIDKLNGAFALTWYDTKAHTVNLIRNSQRPLFYAFTEDRKTVMWASESWMLSVAAMKHGIKLTKVMDLPEMHLTTIGVQFGYSGMVNAIDHVSVRKMEGYKPPVIHSSQVVPFSKKSTASSFASCQKHIGNVVKFSVVGEGCSINGRQPYLEASIDGDEDAIIRIFAGKNSDLWKQMMTSPNFYTGKVLSYSSVEGGYLTVLLNTVTEMAEEELSDEVFLGYNKKTYSKDQMRNLLGKHGCAWCSEISPVSESHELIWCSEDTYICACCQELDTVKEYVTKVN